MTERGERRRSWTERALRVASAVVPGIAHLRQGQYAAGLTLWALAVLGIGLLIVAFDRVRATFTARGAEYWVALITLAFVVLASWTVSLMALRDGRRTSAAGTSQWALAWGEFRRNRVAVLGMYLMGALCLVTLLAPYLTTYDPKHIGDVAATGLLPPSLAHPMGTDRFGRDVLTRVLYGARVSLSIGFVAATIAVTLGTVIGAVSGYFRGLTDGLLMRLVDLMISFPRLVLLITVIALFEPSILVVVLVLGFTLWPSTARIVRGEVLSLREREFIEAARALGYSHRRIIFRHLIPNVLGPVIVAATLGLGNIILIEAGLSFLGMSAPGDVPSWGNMINSGRDVMFTAWWIATFPGLAIVITVVAFNLIGDGLRDALDPRLRM